ncbi:hypothetical protein HUJ05_000919 [Dendroctonus ponderosae]|nr:hypothetical protein HUJ05_000919 [Dendroctonus ponderosae]
MGGGSSSLDNPDEIDDDEDLSETTSEESDDTGVFSPDSFSPANSNSDMEAGLNGITLNSPTRINSVGTEQGIVSIVDGLNLRNINADCSTISNFFGYWYCSVNPVTTARLTGNSCESNGREAEIGFAVTTSRFVRTIQICFNQATQSPIYTYYDLIPAITQQVRGTPRPSWTQGTGIFTLTNVNNLFTQATQRVTINALLGLPTGSFNVIQNNNNYFLSRGHLTATSDFFYAAQQNSTFQFLNALPQWQTFNGFNWDQAETDVQDYAESNNVNLQVWTAVACEINPFEGANPTPLLVRSTSFVYPSSVGRRTITLAAGETVDFACPGGRLVLEGVSTTLQVATASCVSGVRFVVNNARPFFAEKPWPCVDYQLKKNQKLRIEINKIKEN